MEMYLLTDVATAILFQMKMFDYSDVTILQYKKFLSRLISLARANGKNVFDAELRKLYLEDTYYSYKYPGKDNHNRFIMHKRVIQFVESYLATGVIDLSFSKRKAFSELPPEFECAWETFKSLPENVVLAKGTQVLSFNFIHSYLTFLSREMGRKTLEEVRNDDTKQFIKTCLKNHKTSSLTSLISGMRRFLLSTPPLARFINELPERLVRGRSFIEVYTDEEIIRINEAAREESLSERDRAITFLSLKTGIRAVDIRNLKLDDIDWMHCSISINQSKTGRPLVLPLLPEYADPMAKYIYRERPAVESRFVFVSTKAPYKPLENTSAIRRIIKKTILAAGIHDERPIGVMMNRHSHASAMLRRGMPIDVIANSLGHKDINTTMVYLTTDQKGMSECTLPLPLTKEVSEC